MSTSPLCVLTLFLWTLQPPSSSSASSSPTQPTFGWSASNRGTPTSEPQANDVGLGLASILRSPQASSSTPPLVPRDPFDDGAVSFAHDPFANDGSDPDDGADDAPQPLLSSAASSGAANGLSLEAECRRKRSGTISTLGLPQPPGDRSHTISPAPEAYVYDPSSSESEPEDGPHGSHHQRALAPPPLLVRAVSAPVQPARLGNLIHPTRRPSNGGGSRPSFGPRRELVSYSGSSVSASSDSRLLPQHRNSISGNVDGFLPPADPSSSSGARSLAQSRPDSPEQGSASGLYVLTLELADSVQAAIQTLLQVTPPHLFDAAKEQFSACSVQMPATSLSSLLTAMRNLNYLSEHIAPLCADDSLQGSPKAKELGRLSTGLSRSRANLKQQASLPPSSATATGASAEPSPPRSPSFAAGLLKDFGTPSTSLDSQASVASEPGALSQEFDVGEILQSVGDLLGGLMAEAGVDLVLYHGDVGMKHFSVRGDEGGICYVLSHVRRPRPSLIPLAPRHTRLTSSSSHRLPPHRSSARFYSCRNQATRSRLACTCTRSGNRTRSTTPTRRSRASGPSRRRRSSRRCRARRVSRPATPCCARLRSSTTSPRAGTSCRTGRR